MYDRCLVYYHWNYFKYIHAKIIVRDFHELRLYLMYFTSFIKQLINICMLSNYGLLDEYLYLSVIKIDTRRTSFTLLFRDEDAGYKVIY